MGRFTRLMCANVYNYRDVWESVAWVLLHHSGICPARALTSVVITQHDSMSLVKLASVSVSAPL